MLTREQVLEAVKNGRGSKCLDGRDYARLTDFFPVEDWKAFGFGIKDGAAAPEPKPWTEEEIKKQLAADLDFAFEKAMNQRGISTGLMFEVVKMWLWVLEDKLCETNDYDNYALPFFSKVAKNYGFNNPLVAG